MSFGLKRLSILLNGGVSFTLMAINAGWAGCVRPLRLVVEYWVSIGISWPGAARRAGLELNFDWGIRGV